MNLSFNSVSSPYRLHSSLYYSQSSVHPFIHSPRTNCSNHSVTANQQNKTKQFSKDLYPCTTMMFCFDFGMPLQMRNWFMLLWISLCLNELLLMKFYTNYLGNNLFLSHVFVLTKKMWIFFIFYAKAFNFKNFYFVFQLFLLTLPQFHLTDS